MKSKSAIRNPQSEILPPNILHVISGLWKHSGGPAEGIPGLCKALVKDDCNVTLALLDGNFAAPVIDCKNAGVDLQIFKPTIRHTIWYSHDMKKNLPRLIEKFDVIHVWGLWEYPMWLGCKLALKKGIPLVISPLGSINPNALSRSRWKKWIVGKLYDNRHLKSAACLNATSKYEYEGIRQYGLNNPVAVIPHVINFPNKIDLDYDDIFNRFSEFKGRRLMLYVSRINPSKGLIDLAEAFGELAAKCPDWHLVVAGSEEEGHLAEVKLAFKENGIENKVTFTGPVYGKDKDMLFNIAELFVLPTHTESFGIAIAEALSMGMPVITTHGAPWEELETKECGWWVPIGADGIKEALEAALPLPTERLRSMGTIGKKWVENEFSASATAQKMIAVYRWMLNQEAMPEVIYF